MKRLLAVLCLAVPPVFAVLPSSTHTYASNDVSAEHVHVCGAVPAHFARCNAILVVPLFRKPHPTATPTSTSSGSPTPTSTATATATATGTASATATATATPTNTPSATPTATTTGTATGSSCTPVSPVPGGYGACDLESAYNLPSFTAGSGKTVAIVDAYDDPNAESDLGVYRSKYSLPPCTTANGCFRKVNETGGSTAPTANGGWAQEISLDLDMVSAVCPSCHILLVEASSNSFADLGAAENEAVTLGANAISNSYGGGDSSSDSSLDTYYNHPGVVITASSGDSGYGVEYPAASQYVTAVGGTSLTRSSNSRGWSETAWSGAGSGCSAYEPKPSWQKDTGCSKRTVADVSAVADPNTGVAVYDSYAYQGLSGWLIFGGTSVASPLVASVYALAGNTVTYGSYPYSHTSSLNDVTSGSNGSCGGSYLCTAVTGYDGPTGLGTPNGVGAF